MHREQGYVFGTLVEVSIWGEDEKTARKAAHAVLQEFDRLHNMLHAWKPSELSDLNAAFARREKHTVSPELAAILVAATRLAEQSDETFDPAIGKLVRLWGFHADEFKPVRPDPKEVERVAEAKARMSDITIAGNETASGNPAVQVDLGGYAKGYALDRAAQILKTRGVKNALVNIGGNIIALGEHGNRPWRVGIQDPRKPGPIATLDLYDGEAIGTSGDYQRYFELDGKRYCHVIDPRTGYPVQGVRAATVIAQRGGAPGALSDAASKPLFIAGVQGWRHAAAQMGIEEGMLIGGDGEIYVTQRMYKRITINDPKAAMHVIE
jgi:thiamine biosynthesis lipoprotein